MRVNGYCKSIFLTSYSTTVFAYDKDIANAVACCQDTTRFFIEL